MLMDPLVFVFANLKKRVAQFRPKESRSIQKTLAPTKQLMSPLP